MSSLKYRELVPNHSEQRERLKCYLSSAMVSDSMVRRAVLDGSSELADDLSRLVCARVN